MMRRAGAALLAAFFGAASVAQAEITDPVTVTGGEIAGRPADDTGVRAFLGIPFAAPPVDDLRWRAPQPVAEWQDVRDATEFGDVCVQPPGQGRVNVSVDLPDSPPVSEDCLYLNVWTAADAPSDERPVMVWIYGGAYTEGAGSSPHNWGDTLARKGVVLVTFNYRLGPFGFFAHPALAAESPHDASGNYALMDAVTVLQWVRDNIGAFGGDPDNVTVFGESAGAAILAGLVGSPLAEGLFERGIAQSGAWMGLGMAPMRPQDSAQQAGAEAAAALGAETAADLRDLSTEDVAANLRGFGMIVDGWVVPEDLSITFAEGRQNAVDMIVGSNAEEGSFLPGGPPPAQWRDRAETRWGDLSDDFLKVYPGTDDAATARSAAAVFSDEMAWHMRLFAERQEEIGQKAYLYEFAHEPPADPDKRALGAVHTAEIPYVFDNLAAPRVFPDTSSPELASQSAEDRKLAEDLSAYWVNFATDGDPNGGDLPHWPPYGDMQAGEAMVLDVDKGVAAVMSPDKQTLFDTLYERQLSGE